MANYKKWLQAELDFISNNKDILNDKILANKLSEMTGQNISSSMVRRQRRKLGMHKKRGRPKKRVSVENYNEESIS